MPIPKPKKDENKDDFIERCMSNETMKKEFDDNDQRLAVCYQQWKDKDKKMENENIEKRNIMTELRVISDDNGLKKIVGYAAVFDKWSSDLMGFREKISPGAFSKTIKKNDVRALFNHDPNIVLGRTKAKTLKLKEDDTGLFMEVIPPDTQQARDIMVSIERGDIGDQSFAFRTIEDEWVYKKDGSAERTLIEVDLQDVSPVTYPAYPDTSVALRSLDEFKKENVTPAQQTLAEEELKAKQTLANENLKLKERMLLTKQKMKG